MKYVRSMPYALSAGCLVACFFVLLVSGCGGGGTQTGFRGRVKASGSTTLLPIAQEAAVEFADANKGSRVDVQGGGSSVGITQLGEGIVDIANSSRELNPDELTKGFVDNRVAFDVIAIVVNPALKIRDLSDRQIKAVFTGGIKNWKALGGPDKEIIVVVRDQASGTREMFDKKALGASETNIVDCVPSAIECSSNGVVREIVRSTGNAIGYISFGYITRDLKAISFNGIAPTVKNAASHTYPIARYLHMFTKGEPKGAAKGYIDFVLSDKFQDEIVSQEYIKIKAVQP